MRMEKICGKCFHYRPKDLENPCAKGNKYCGYLIENKPCWEENEGDIDEDSVMKLCVKCGQLLPLKMFYKTKKTKDKYSNLCRTCKPYPVKRKRKYV